MSVWKKAMFYLGLGPEDSYEGAPPPVGMMPEEGMAPPMEAGGGHVAALPSNQAAPGNPSAVSSVPAEASAVRALGPMDVKAQQSSGLTSVGSVGSPSPASSAPVPTPGGTAARGGINTVRPLPASASSSSKPHVVAPRTFNDAQEVADRFRSGAPVIMNLQEVERDLSRRLIDFASGMCYGLAGQMEKISDRVYLLSPVDTELSPEHRRELHEQGLHNG